MKNKKTVIFDLDGTLALINKRRTLATKDNGKLNWKVFFEPQNIQLDEPNPSVIESFKAMKLAGFHVGIFSGRDSISRKETETWLSENGVEYDFLKMRVQGSHEPDDSLKKRWMEDLIGLGYEIMCVFDDRDKVVKMWRENGVDCFQVAPGSF